MGPTPARARSVLSAAALPAPGDVNSVGLLRLYRLDGVLELVPPLRLDNELLLQDTLLRQEARCDAHPDRAVVDADRFTIEKCENPQPAHDVETDRQHLAIPHKPNHLARCPHLHHAS